MATTERCKTSWCWLGLLLMLWAGRTATASATTNLFLVAEEDPNILISVATGLCLLNDDVFRQQRDCHDMGVYHVLGLKEKMQQEQGMLIHAAVALFRNASCPLHWKVKEAAVLVHLEDINTQQDANTFWLTVEDLGTSYDDFKREKHRLVCVSHGSDLQHFTGLCSENEAQSEITAIQRRRALQQNTTSGRLVAWDPYTFLNSADYLTQMMVVPMHRDLSVPGVVTAVAAGTFHSVALLFNGSVVEWGHTYPADNLPLQMPSEVNTVGASAIAAGSFHTCAILRGTGKVHCWSTMSREYQNLVVPPTAVREVQAIRATHSMSFAQLADSTWTAWGQQTSTWLASGFNLRTDIVDVVHDLYMYTGISVLLSNGTLLQHAGTYAPPASIVNGHNNVSAICCGAGYALATLSNATLVGWGHPAFSGAWQQIPEYVQGHVATVACGPAYVITQLTNGTFATWGGWSPGRKPITATNLPSSLIKSFAAGAYHSVFLQTDNSIIEEGSHPLPLTQLTDVTAVSQSVSQSITMAVRQDNSLAVWGDTIVNIADDWWYAYPAPTPIISDPIVSIAVGRSHAVLLLQSGRVLQWGDINSTIPSDVQLGGVTAIAAGRHFTLALKAGRVYAWGDANQFLCSGAPQDSNNTVGFVLSVPEAASSNVIQISATFDHALALLSNGTVVAWGCNILGQTDVPLKVTGGDVIDVAAGAGYSLALPKHGPVVLWRHMQPLHASHVPATINWNATSMQSAGFNFAVALLHNQSVVTWDDWYGELFTPSKVQGLTAAVSAGLRTCVALISQNAPDIIMPPPMPPSPPSSPPISAPPAQPTLGSLVGWGTGYYEKPLPPPTNVTVGGNVTSIVTGESHALALHGDGRVTAWGDNSAGQLDIPSLMHTGHVQAVSASILNSLALMQSGAVLCWGDSFYGQCNFTIEEGAQAIRSAYQSSFVQQRNGTWSVWGYHAQSWYDSGMDKMLNIVDIIDDWYHSFSSGLLVRLNNGSVLGEPGQPAAALIGVNVTSICSGLSGVSAGYVLALDIHGYVWSWGYTSAACQAVWRGISDNVQGRTKSIFCGYSFAIAGIEGGSPVSWGKVPQGRVSAQSQPAATGDGFALYLTSSHNVQQIGILSVNKTGLLVPPDLGEVQAISASTRNVVALMSDGSVTAWGPSDTGRVSQLPVEFSNGNTAVHVAAGFNHAIAVLANGLVVQWGQVDIPQLPAEIASANIQAVAAGGGFSMALTADGAVIAWIVSSNGIVYRDDVCTDIVNVPTTVQSNVAAISAGYNSALALKRDGSVVAWGCDPYISGYLSVPPAATTDVIDIAAGGDDYYYYSLALLTNGTVVAWGDNTYNQTQVPEAAKANVIAIAAGSWHAAALLNNDTVVTWGDNSTGQLNVPDEVQGRVMAIAAHIGGTLAIVRPAVSKPPPPSPPPPPPSPAVVIATPPAPSSATTGISPSPQSNQGELAGIITASLGAVLLLAVGAATYAWHSKRKQAKADWQPVVKDIDGLKPGEVFTRATAHEYRWCDSAAAEAAVPLTGVVDASAIVLSKEQVQQQILLVKDGLLGRGATALAFKCLWPSRFGNNALLAAKVLKDGYEADISTLQSFYYEATVLASLNPPHANVVRLYGYCLEPPTVCLILELLPGSLKCLLYRTPATDNLNQSNSAAVQKHKATSNMTTFMTSSSDTDLGTTSSTTCTTYITIHDNPSATDKDATCAPTATPLQSALEPQQLSMLRVLQICTDISAGLKYLHDMPLVAEAAAAQTSEERTPLGPVDEGETSCDDQQQQQQTQELTAGPVTRSMKVVHRDLKPANILIAADGTAKISDFGLARQQMKTTVMTEHLGAGTLPYMAPELLVSVRVGTAAMPASNRVDTYSMSMIMWELLAGRPPWSHMNEPSLLAAVMSGRRPELPPGDSASKTPITVPLSELPASLHAMPEFNAIIRACWNQREHRRPSAAALHDMLVSLLNKYTSHQ